MFSVHIQSSTTTRVPIITLNRWWILSVVVVVVVAHASFPFHKMKIVRQLQENLDSELPNWTGFKTFEDLSRPVKTHQDLMTAWAIAQSKLK